MNRSKESFLINRIRSIKFSLRGIWILILTERSIKIQLFMGIFITLIGLFAELTSYEWMAQSIVIGIVLVAEALNTSIEKISDFIHPNYHEKIAIIKDIGAGAAGIAAIVSIIIIGIIYIPRIQMLF